MAWEDRPYYRDRPSGGPNPLMWLLSGSVRLFEVFRIEVRAHASLLVLIALVLLSDLLSARGSLANGATSMTILFASVLLHEFGHCFAARSVGGSANDILLWPLGGLAYAAPPERPLPTFITVAAGPLVNLTLCAAALVGLRLISPAATSGLHLYLFEPLSVGTWREIAFYLHWIYSVNMMLLLFNLLPIYPMDGGQMLQTILWPMIGYHRSLVISCWVGMVGSVLLIGYGFANGMNLFMVTLAICLLINCAQRLAMLRAAGAEGYGPEPTFQTARAHHRRPGRWGLWRARRRMRQEEVEQTKVDRILEKVSLHGMHSLTWWERRVLRVATEHQRAREMEDVR